MPSNPFDEINLTLAKIIEEISSLHSKVDNVTAARTESSEPRFLRRNYPVNQAAEFLNRNPYTVREWCRLGRINATLSNTRKGKGSWWLIKAEELDRFLNEGLLPVDMNRNKI